MLSFFKNNYKKILVIIILFLLGMSTYLVFRSKTSKAFASYMEYPVVRKNIKVTISGTGVLNSSSRQDVSSKVAGTVKKVNFNEGDKVKTGSVLYELDNRTIVSQIEKLRFNIQQAEVELERNKEDVANLSICTSTAGRVNGLTLKIGDSVNKGMEICTIEDTAVLKLVVPFNGKQIESFYNGQIAKIYVEDYMRCVNGTVNYIDKSGRIEPRGARVYDVEILIDNTIANIGVGVTASAEIGGTLCLGSSKVGKGETIKIKSQVSGTVKSLGVRENEQVYIAQVIVQLENDEPARQVVLSEQKIEELNIQLDDLVKDLEECKGIANIDGTIITQNVKVGDYVKSGEVVSKIANYETMEFDISVDELDIAGVKTGMEATVTVGAIPDRKYSGTVIKVAKEGTSQGGVATYPVTILMKNPELLMGGMNANAEIVIQQKNNVLTVPLTAVQKVGNQSFVLVHKKSDNEVEVFGTETNNTRVRQGRTNTNVSANAIEEQIEDNIGRVSTTRNSVTGVAGQLNDDVNRTEGRVQGGSDRVSSEDNNAGRAETQAQDNINRVNGEVERNGQEGAIDRGSRAQRMTGGFQGMSRLREYGANDIEMKRIEIGVSDNSDIEVVEGLNEGDVVLVSSTNLTSGTGRTQSPVNFRVGGMGGIGSMGGNRGASGVQQSTIVERRSR